MRPSLIPLLLCFALAGLAAAQDPVVEVGERRLALADLNKLREEGAQALIELRKVDPPNEVQKAEMADQESRIRILDDAIRLFETLRRLGDPLAELEKQTDARRQAVAAARSAPPTPPVIESATEEELQVRVNAEERAKRELALAQETLKAAEAALSAMQIRGESIAKESTANLAEHDAIRAPLQAPDLTPEAKTAIEQRLFYNEIRQSLLELERQRLPDLVHLAEAERDQARVTAELADIAAKEAQANLVAAREARTRQLEAEKLRLQREAEEKTRESERQAHPTLRAVKMLEAAAATIAGQMKEEESRSQRLDSRIGVETTEARLIEERNQTIRERLPLGERLDDRRQDYLVSQVRRLRAREDEARRHLQEVDGRHAEALGEVQDRLDRLNTLLDAITDDEQSLGTAEEGRRSGGERDPLVEQWIQAQREWTRGQTSSSRVFSEERLKELQTSWDAAQTAIRDTATRRKALLVKLESAAEEEIRLARRSLDLLLDRRAHLETLSFWLREPWIFAGEEMKKAGDDLRILRLETGRMLKDTLDELAGAWGEPRGRVALALLVVAFLVAARRLLRRAAISPTSLPGPGTPGHLLLPLSRALRASSEWILIAAALGLIAGTLIGPDPGMAGIQILVLAATIWRLGDRLLVICAPVAAEGEAGSERSRTFSEARRILNWSAAGLLPLAPLVAICDRLDLPRLSHLLWFALTLLALFVCARLVRRRDVLNLMVVGSDGKLWSRVISMAIRFGRPLLVLFVLAILVLQSAGYRNAGRIIGLRCVTSILVILGTNLLFQVMIAWIESRPKRGEGEDVDEETRQAWLARRRQLLLRALEVLVFAGTIVLTLIGLRWALGLTAESIRAFGAFDVVSAHGDRPGVQLVDLLRGMLIFAIALILGGLLRDAILVGFQPADEQARGTRLAWGTLLFYVVVVLGSVIGLGSIGIEISELGWLLAPAGVAIGFGMTEILSNFVSGIILMVERPVKVGDIVTIGDIEGDVKMISIRAAVVRTRDGISIIIPNRRLIEENVINWSHGEPRTRMHVKVGVAYGTDVPLVKKVLTEVAERDSRVLSNPRPEVSFTGFGDSQLDFVLLLWLASPDITVRRRVLSDINSSIDAAFRRNGIEIPFPQRDLHVRDLPPRPRRGADAPPESIGHGEAD